MSILGDGRLVGEGGNVTWSVLGQCRVPLSRDELVRVRTSAFRRKIWFKVLTRTERALIDLTIKVVERVRSHLLAMVLAYPVRKLLEAMKGEVLRLMGTVGRDLAQRLSRIAQGWGNESAVGWVEERGFVQYLTLNHMNTLAMLRA